MAHRVCVTPFALTTAGPAAAPVPSETILRQRSFDALTDVLLFVIVAHEVQIVVFDEEGLPMRASNVFFGEIRNSACDQLGLPSKAVVLHTIADEETLGEALSIKMKYDSTITKLALKITKKGTQFHANALQSTRFVLMLTWLFDRRTTHHHAVLWAARRCTSGQSHKFHCVSPSRAV